MLENRASVSLNVFRAVTECDICAIGWSLFINLLSKRLGRCEKLKQKQNAMIYK